MKRQNWVVTFTLILTILSGVARAEDFASEVSGQTVIDTSGANGNANADRIAAGMTADPNTVVDTTKTNSSLGREQKAQDASSTAGAGMGIAIGTGAALMARGVPMLASPFPEVVATGAALIAKAGLEFAQAGVDNGSQKANKAQENQLRAEAGQNGQSAQQAMEEGKKEVQNKVAEMVGNNPELAKTLADKGVNPEDFSKRFAAGEYNSPESVLAATGTGANVDAAALAQGIAAAAQPEPLGKQNTETTLALDSAPAGMSSRGGAGSAPGSLGLSAEGKTPGAEAHADKRSGLEKAMAAAGGAMDLLKNASEAELASMLAGFMGMGAAGAGKEAEGANGILKLDRAALEKKGILQSPGKPTIFQLAHRNYRSFKKWRKKMEVVAIR